MDNFVNNRLVALVLTRWGSDAGRVLDILERRANRRDRLTVDIARFYYNRSNGRTAMKWAMTAARDIAGISLV